MILRYWENLAIVVYSFSKFHKEIRYLDLLTRQEKRRNSLFTDSIEVLMLVQENTTNTFSLKVISNQIRSFSFINQDSHHKMLSVSVS